MNEGDMMMDFDHFWNEGIVSFDTCSLGRMYEWEYKYSVNIKDALSYLYTTNKLWETSVTIDELNGQRDNIRNNIFDMKYNKGIFKNLLKRPIPWNKIEGTLGRWEARGFSEYFKNELLKLKGKSSITEKEYFHIVSVAPKTSIIDFENLFDKILESDNLKLTDEEKRNLEQYYDAGNMCPGAGDSRKHNGNKYNDLFIWELLKKKAIQDNTDIIFVTADTAKGDWFIDGHPRYEYLQDFSNDTGYNILIISLTDFWDNCEKYLDISIEEFIELSSIKDQIEKKYDSYYQEDICSKIDDLIFESDDINDLLAGQVDSCVDNPVIEELEETKIVSIDIEYYDDEKVYVSILLQSKACFEARNHTDGEDWTAGYGYVDFDIEATAEIPIEWSSEDTGRCLPKDEISVIEITDIKVIDSVEE